ncbi:MAG TPA: YggS family pyridoxal phosphate-dependent enzyme [Gemmatimonadales bacterium]|nr:YggS family pyridoxal phosphate-dependent enzyme [Gemmatimonadales bacterium]
MFAALATNLARVREDIERAQAAHGLRGDVQIVAVTKGQPVQAVRAAYAAGLLDIGENRVQEALDKQGSIADLPVTWHLIGHLQTNKAKHVPGRFGWVHSVDSWKVAQALARATPAATPPLAVLVQVNVAGEAQKSGCHPAEAGDLAAAVAGLPELRLKGLMTMAPYTDDEAVQRRVFGELRRLRDRLRSPELPLTDLSMGMSGDYRAAVAEGATILRLGTALFGERPA